MTVRLASGLFVLMVVVAGCQTPVDDEQLSRLDVPAATADSTGDSPAAQASDAHPLKAFEERNDDPLAAAADRYERRLSADGTIPPRALLNALDQREAMAAVHARGGSSSPNWLADWTWVGPGNIGGRLRPIVIDPTDTNVIYIGSASGGVWKTTNGGAMWFPLDDFLPSLAVGDMVMHPNDSDILYLGTGEGFFETVEGTSNTAAVRGAGIFVTTDAGSTWTQLPATDTPDFWFVNRLEFDPTDSATMLAATGTGIWRTTDSGASWNLQHAVNALDVKFNPNNPLQVVAGVHEHGDEPLFSTDGGITWQHSTGAGGERQEISWAENQSQTVYAAVSGSNGRIRVWRSTDGGATFTLRTSGNGISTYSTYNNTIWVDPTNANFLVLGGVWLYSSTDGGTTFAQRFNAVHADMHRIVAHPAFDGTNQRTVYFACDGGIYRTSNVYGTTATGLNNNLGVTQFYGGGINPDTGFIIGGTQDNGTLFYSGDPQNWFHLFGGDGGYGASDPADSNYFYGEVQRAYIHRTTNGGTSASYIWNTANPIQDAGSTDSNFIPFFMLDPNEPNRMLVACKRLWRSNNVKAAQPDWFSIKDSIAPPEGQRASGGGKPGQAHFATNSPWNLSTVAVAPGNSNVIWAAHNNGSLYRTDNGTTTNPTWIRVDENGTGLPDRWISTVVVDPVDHNIVYVAFMGWEADNLWMTIDNGKTWTDISGSGASGIPDTPISAFAQHRQLPGWLFVGTDIGIFSSTNGGSSWQPHPGSPALVPVEQLLWKDDHSLLAVTHGRGMYVADESPVIGTSSKLLDGVVASGQLANVNASDDVYYQLDPSPTNNLAKQKVDLIVQSTSPVASPAVIQFRLQAKMTGGPEGDVVQAIALFNYQTGQFEQVDLRAATVTDTTMLVSPGGDRSRFVQTGTDEITASVTWTSPSFTGAPFEWSVDVDELVWFIQ